MVSRTPSKDTPMSYKDTPAWQMLRAAKKRAKRLHRKHRPLARRNAVDKYVFIVTYGRSGSTLLQNLVGSLPGAHLLGENAGVPFKLAMAYKDATLIEDQQGPWISLKTSPWFGAEFFSADAFGQDCADLIHRHLLRPPRGTRIVGFKEIRWLDPDNDIDAAIAFLTKYFPKAYFVFNIRDPESTSRSGWWKDYKPEVAVARITDMRDRLIAKAAEIDNAVLADYDVFSQDPYALKPVIEFLGETFDPDTLESVLGRKLDHTGV